MEADLDIMGEFVGIEGELTNESNGLPSISGSGLDPNLELFDADRTLPPAVVKEPFGDIMKPAGEYPPARAAALTSTMEDVFEICREIADMPWLWLSSKEDRRLSERFCESHRSLIAWSMEDVMLRRSAVRSRCSMLPVYAPCRCSTCTSGVGCRKAFRPDAVLTIGEGIVVVADVGSRVVAGLRRLGCGMCNGT